MKVAKIRDPQQFRAALEAVGSYRTLAAAVGVTFGYVGHLALGRRKAVSPRLAIQIAKTLEVEPEELFVMPNN